jgi:hypothetical protein
VLVLLGFACSERGRGDRDPPASVDAGSVARLDAGQPFPDAGGSGADSGTPQADAGRFDGGTTNVDAGVGDAGTVDAGTVDAAATDGGAGTTGCGGALPVVPRPVGAAGGNCTEHGSFSSATPT